MTDPTNDQVEPVELQRDTSQETQAGPAEGLSAEQQELLVRVLRVAYPHDKFPDGPYQRTVEAIRATDGADAVLAAGLEALDAAGGGKFVDLDDAAATAAIKQVADSDFFKLIHSTTVVALYDDHEVWQILGYEGASFDKGGYINRGFNDLDWLPDPRVEEYTDEARIELVEEKR